VKRVWAIRADVVYGSCVHTVVTDIIVLYCPEEPSSTELVLLQTFAAALVLGVFSTLSIRRDNVNDSVAAALFLGEVLLPGDARIHPKVQSEDACAPHCIAQTMGERVPVTGPTLPRNHRSSTEQSTPRSDMWRESVHIIVETAAVYDRLLLHIKWTAAESTSDDR
jgi:hypothetical protein